MNSSLRNNLVKLFTWNKAYILQGNSSKDMVGSKRYLKHVSRNQAVINHGPQLGKTAKKRASM